MPPTSCYQKLEQATIIHLANHINNSLTNLTCYESFNFQCDLSDSGFEGEEGLRFFSNLSIGTFSLQHADNLDHLLGTEDSQCMLGLQCKPGVTEIVHIDPDTHKAKQATL
jgi:hypothetical protein